MYRKKSKRGIEKNPPKKTKRLRDQGPAFTCNLQSWRRRTHYCWLLNPRTYSRYHYHCTKSSKNLPSPLSSVLQSIRCGQKFHPSLTSPLSPSCYPEVAIQFFSCLRGSYIDSLISHFFNYCINLSQHISGFSNTINIEIVGQDCSLNCDMFVLPTSISAS